MTKQQLNQLGKTLWNIADKLRGAMNADDFRDYMLAFLFLRYLSENFEQRVKKELNGDYPVLDAGDKRHPLQVWYEQNPDEQAEFDNYLKQQLHYVIPPSFLWSNIVMLAKNEDKALLNTLQDGFKYIENNSFSNNFSGLFSEINLTSEKLGKDYTARNAILCKIIAEIADGIAEFSTDTDILGDAYEYLIAQFAAGSGKKAGEFYTPQPISTVLSRIVTLDSQDPALGVVSELKNVLDFACGSGSLLLNIRTRLHEHGGKIGKIFGQEKNITTYNLARMNMLLHGVQDNQFQIFHGDTLTNDWGLLNEPNPAKKQTFDAIVANPPFSLKWSPDSVMGEDFRFKAHGLAPKSAADFAFLLHGFHFLDDAGTMAIILPHGVLFRGGAEAKIRKKLLEDGNIDTVIGLPSNLFFSTGIPVCIIVLKKCKKHDDVLFINASEHFEKGKRQNVLREEDIDKIVDTYQYRKDEDRYARRVSLDEIENNDFNLNITPYVSTAEAEEPVDLAEVNKELHAIEKRIADSKAKHNSFLRELGLSELP